MMQGQQLSKHMIDDGPFDSLFVHTRSLILAMLMLRAAAGKECPVVCGSICHA